MTGKTHRAGIYARISLDTEGTRLGVDRQIEDCSAKASALGWPVVSEYVDNDVSATKAKVRPEYERLLVDLEAGRINAVVVYDLDRLTRKPVELESFIDLTDRLKVGLANVSGDVDLTTASGRMNARIKGAVARQEAERIGERVKRQKEQRLAAGKPPGSRWRTFGFTRDWQVVPGEAAIVREVFERVAAGESLNSVTNDLRARGVKRVSGERWSYQATNRMADSPIYAGRLSYKGQQAGKADVPALVSEALYDAANARRERKPGRVRARRHLLSGTAVCSACLTPMTVTGRAKGGRTAYVCNRLSGGCGNVSVSRDPLDSLVENAIKTGLFVQSVTGTGPSPEQHETEQITSQIEALDDRIEQTHGAVTDGTLAFEDGLAMLADLRKKRQVLDTARKRAAETSAKFLKPLNDFETADLGQRVAEVRRNITAILVHPLPVERRGVNRFDPARVEVVLSDGERVSGTVLAEHSIRFGTIPADAA